MCQLYKEKNRLRLKLNKKEEKTIIHIRDRDEKPYRRERASAILKIAKGQSPYYVSQSGLLKKRAPYTVYSWLKSFAQKGISSLTQKKRKRPDRLNEKEKKELLRIIQTKTPMEYGSLRFRWSLDTLLRFVPMLARCYRSTSSVWYLLKRLGISYKRGRDWTKSPDKGKTIKIRRIRAYLGYARSHPEKVALFFLDEFSFYRQPIVGRAWWPKGRRKQPKAIRSCKSDTRGRIVGAINAVDGELTYKVASAIKVEVFCDFLNTLAVKYNHLKIYVVLDNWPTVHCHHKTIETFKQLGMVPLFLPTYCPESNPIEKVWQGVTDNILKLHKDSNDFKVLKQHVIDWLNRFVTPSKILLQMTGLLKGRAIVVNP